MKNKWSSLPAELEACCGKWFKVNVQRN